MAVDGWAELATLNITLMPGEEEVAGWKNVATFTITLMPGEEEVAEWKHLATITVTLAPSTGEVAQWKLLDTKTITLIIPTIECSIDGDCPEGYVCIGGFCVKKAGLSPLALAAIGAGAIGAIILAKKKPVEKKKPSGKKK